MVHSLLAFFKNHKVLLPAGMCCDVIVIFSKIADICDGSY